MKILVNCEGNILKFLFRKRLNVFDSKKILNSNFWKFFGFPNMILTWQLEFLSSINIILYGKQD